NYMFRNYLKVAWRNLVKNKTHSVINIAGLSVGLACSSLILLWVQNESSVDGFFQHSGRLYKVYKTNFDHHVPSGSYEMPGILADELKRGFPDIEYATNMGFGENSVFQVGAKVVKMTGNSAGADFFKMFSYPLLAGSAQTALNSPDAISISRNMAEIFYGSAGNAIGKTVRYQNQKDFKITAVFENLPKNASQSFDFLTNWDAFLHNNPWAKDMGNNGPHAYVMLRPQANAAAVNAKIAHVFDLYYHINRNTANWYADIALQPYAEAYLHNDISTGKPAGGRIEYVHLFSIIAIFILLIACINFMNLSTARSVKRAKEVGVRKVAGALRGSLIWQFISESILVTLFAVFIALVLVVLLLPEFNQITHKQIGLPFAQPGFWFTILGITLVTGLVAGSYPALFLSAFKPVKVLKSAVKLDTGTLFFRKGLVVFQFVLSVVLITGTMIVSRQMTYLESKDLGYDRENVVYLPIEGQLSSQYAVFKNELLTKPGIQSVSRVNSAPINIYGSSPAVDWIGHDSTSNILFTRAFIGFDYFKTMKLTLRQGREFSKAYPSDSNSYILNETALKVTGYKDPIGKPFRYMGKRGTIVGIVKDFHFHSLHEAIGPMVLVTGEHDPSGVVLVRTQPGQTKAALAAIENLSKELNPAFPPVIYFVDEQYQQLYENEQVINKLSDVFAGLAIFISCLGLLGLAMFTAEQRVREIGIRKVLGASVISLFRLLSAEFITLIGIAIAVALPVGWYATNGWLQGFAYRAPLHWWVFALSAGLIVVIALITISFQLIKVALVNPVKSLKGE
ncbi:MAG: ABC transporter permease, partial [Mucilaginibacter sp.]